jgi:hypothetical protein
VHRLSIDIAMGAAAMLFGLSQALMLPIPLYFYLLLVNGTFIIYWIDHIQDSTQALLVQPGARHAIFKEKRSVFVGLILLLTLVNALIAWLFLSVKIILAGTLLLLALLAYLRFHRKLKRVFILEKELLIALLYTISTGLPTWIYFQSNFVLDWLVFVLLLLSVFLTALQNLFSVARIEKEQDSQFKIRNISQIFGSARLQSLQEMMLLLQGVTLIFLLLLFPQIALLRFAVSLLLLAFIQYILPYFFTSANNPYYRWLGDGSFVLLFLCGI